MGDGEVFDSGKLKNTIQFLIENDMRNIVIDLGSLEYIYSDTINVFISSNRHMLEKSGRIAILTEHPKVQDILKRAGLDNIMRIYRSEAEMIADSKEILRQTSSYRIEELQRLSEARQGAPRTEFDDFRMEMGEQLSQKIESDSFPDYQVGVSPPDAQAFPGFGVQEQTPPGFPSQSASGFAQVPPLTPPIGNGIPDGFGSFGTAGTHQGSAGYGGFPGTENPPAHSPVGGNTGVNNPGVTNPYGAPPNGGYPTGGFDFPTQQLPITPMSGEPPRHGLDTHAGPGFSQDTASRQDMSQQDESEDGASSRQRRPSSERALSPSARRRPIRRVGGREDSDREKESASGLVVMDDAQQDERTTMSQPAFEKAGALLEENSGSGKLVWIFIVLLAVLGGGVFFWINQSKPDLPPVVAAPAPVTQPEAVVSEPVTEPEPVVAEPQRQDPRRPAAREPAPRQPVERESAKTAAKPERAQPQEKVITITSEPAGAEVLVNFSNKGVTPLEVALTGNTNRIIVRKSGFKQYQTNLPKNTDQTFLNLTLEAEAVAADPEPAAPARQAAPTPPPPPPPPAEDEPKVVRIVSDPPGAEVLVNFANKGITPVEVSLTNSSNKIILRKEGFRDYETTVAKSAARPEMSVSLQREPAAAPPPPPPVAKPEPKPATPTPVVAPPPAPKAASAPSPGKGPPGQIFLSSSPARADIIINGVATGKKTPVKVELPSGSHRIEMVKDGQRGLEDRVINEGNNKALHLSLQ